MKHSLSLIAGTLIYSALISSCALSGESGHGSEVSHSNTGKPLASFPTVEKRASDIASESPGNYYIGRRYFVNKTTFWGYLRKPKQSWGSANLATMNEWSKLSPDRLPQNGPSGAKLGYDQNHEYKIWGHYTGDKVYDPSSNTFVDEFKLTNFQLIDSNPGWLFGPDDLYNPDYITLRKR